MGLVWDLLEGRYIIECRNRKGERRPKLFEGNMAPIEWLKPCWLKPFEKLLRYADKKKTRKVLDLRAVRKLHGNDTIKKIYKSFKREQANKRQNIDG